MKYCKKFVKFCNDDEWCSTCMERSAYSDRQLRKYYEKQHLFDEFNSNIATTREDQRL